MRKVLLKTSRHWTGRQEVLGVAEQLRFTRENARAQALIKTFVQAEYFLKAGKGCKLLNFVSGHWQEGRIFEKYELEYTN